MSICFRVNHQLHDHDNVSSPETPQHRFIFTNPRVNHLACLWKICRISYKSYEMASHKSTKRGVSHLVLPAHISVIDHWQLPWMCLCCHQCLEQKQNHKELNPNFLVHPLQLQNIDFRKDSSCSYDLYRTWIICKLFVLHGIVYTYVIQMLARILGTYTPMKLSFLALRSLKKRSKRSCWWLISSHGTPLDHSNLISVSW